MLSGTLFRYRPGFVNVQIDTGIETTVACYGPGGLSTCCGLLPAMHRICFNSGKSRSTQNPLMQ